jgi:hypothetical protein
MNNLRLTIIMFILAATLAPIALVGFGGIARETVPEQAPASPIDMTAFAPAGLKQAPWEGAGLSRPAAANRSRAPEPVKAEPFALVELFTSEGCSSCPPADALLNEMAAPGPASRRLVCVAYHVDYWDYLGWKDPFASGAYAERQRQYAKLLKDERVYTPQVVVNGKAGFVGSDRRRMTEAIDTAMAAAPTAQLIATVEKTLEAGETATVLVRLTGISEFKLPADVRVLAAITEDGLASKVTRGENEGRELKHDAVCRGLVEGRLDAAGAATLRVSVPASVKPERARMAVWAQAADGRVLGAVYAIPAVKK